MAKPIGLFYSYAHADESYADSLRKHLAILKRQGLICDWHDRQITAGRDWEQEINQHLETADIVLLLVSADFLASDYCWSREMNRALQRHDAGEARVIPVAVHPVDWEGAPFAKLQGLPKAMKPISQWQNSAEALADVAQGIRRVIKEMGKNEDLLSRGERAEAFAVEAAYCPNCKSTSVYRYQAVDIEAAAQYYEGWRIHGSIVNCTQCGMSLQTTARMIKAEICKELSCIECGSGDHPKLR